MRNHTSYRRLLVAGAFALCATFAMGQETLAISSVKPTPALQKALTGAGKGTSLDRVIEAFDSQLIDRVNATRKFTIVGRSELKDLLKEQDLEIIRQPGRQDRGAGGQDQRRQVPAGGHGGRF